MITKITYQMRSSMTMYPNERRVPYGDHHFEDGCKHIGDDARHLKSVAQLVSFLNQFPDHNVRQAIGAHYAGKVDVKEYTKKRRVYSIPCLWIHEEDKD